MGVDSTLSESALTAIQNRFKEVDYILTQVSANKELPAYKYYKRITGTFKDMIYSMYMYNTCVKKPDMQPCLDVVSKIINDFKTTRYFGMMKNVNEGELKNRVSNINQEDAARQLLSCYQNITSSKFQPNIWEKCDDGTIKQLAFMHCMNIEQKIIDLHYANEVDDYFRKVCPEFDSMLPNINAKGIQVGGITVIGEVLLGFVIVLLLIMVYFCSKSMGIWGTFICLRIFFVAVGAIIAAFFQKGGAIDNVGVTAVSNSQNNEACQKIAGAVILFIQTFDIKQMTNFIPQFQALFKSQSKVKTVWHCARLLLQMKSRQTAPSNEEIISTATTLLTPPVNTANTEASTESNKLKIFLSQVLSQVQSQVQSQMKTGGKSLRTHVTISGIKRKCKVHYDDKKRKYIKMNRKIVYLSEIKGKYRYV